MALWGFEKRWVDPAEIDQGPVPHARVNRVWFYATCVLLLLAAPFLTFPLLAAIIVPSALVLGRLAAVDLGFLLLLDVYTLPLAIAGLLLGPTLHGDGVAMHLFGLVAGGAVGLLFDLALRLFRPGQADLGFGDVKMMAVVGAWVGLLDLPFAFTVATVAHLVWSFTQPKGAALPFGPALVAGLWVITLWGPMLQDMLLKALT